MAAIQHVFLEDRPREQPHLTTWLNHRNTALASLLKPRRLRPGDTVAAISLSWGGPGAYPHRYQIGKKQFADEFGVQVVETRHALRDPTWLARNPKARADDLMEAFADRSIAGIVSTIGGDDSIRLLPHLSLEVIRANPKVFLGYSDTTVSHFTCLRAGLTSFYGPAFMAGFAENGGMFPFMATSVRKTIFTSDAIGVIEPNRDGWTVEHLAWSVPEHQHQRRKLTKPAGWKFLQGGGRAQGRLIGGCFESLQSLRATPVWPDANWFDGAILFLETSEEGVPPRNVTRELRTYASTGILQKLSGILFGRPGGTIPPETFEKYDEAILKVVAEEEGLTHLPVVTHMDFGHTDPMFVLPYGLMAEIDCAGQRFAILESAVTD
jgi:muramoyltetrapeptide carboxypeptidase LdcA involved in peptidoglycan recycling